MLKKDTMEIPRAVIFLILSLVSGSSSWVFTDVNYPARSVAVNQIITDGIELTREEYEIQARFNLIYPGTKWCGPGTIAVNPDDLGTEVEADMCCREHDLCPDIMLGGTTKNNLTNEAFYTRLNCACDNRFRECLRAANTTTATRIGIMYFDVMNQHCYREDYPVLGCLRRTGFLRRKCAEYKYDTNGQKLYQWFDVPSY